MNRRNVLKSVATAAAGAGLMVAAGEAARAEGAKISTAARLLPGSFIQARDGTSLFYKDWGKGEPVLFVPSWALNTDM